MKDKLDFWKILNDLNKHILYKKEDVLRSGLSDYMLLHFLKSNPILLNVGNYLNKHKKIPLYDKYLFVFLTFKRFNISGIKWIKVEKQIKEEDIDIIIRYYGVTHREALYYLEKLSKQKIEEIKSLYNYNL